MNNSASGRNYYDGGYPQQQRYDNNSQARRSNNYPMGNGNRGRRGSGANSYRTGGQNDTGKWTNDSKSIQYWLFHSIGYDERRRDNDNENTTYDTQDNTG